MVSLLQILSTTSLEGSIFYLVSVRHGRRSGPQNTPTALNTDFGWVLAGNTGPQANTLLTSSYLTSVVTGDDLLCRFWEVEEKTVANCTLSVEERCALEHFYSHHSRNEEGRFVVPLPKHSMELKLGESRSQAVHRHSKDLSAQRVSSLKSRKWCKSTLTSNTLKKSHKKTLIRHKTKSSTYPCT